MLNIYVISRDYYMTIFMTYCLQKGHSQPEISELWNIPEKNFTHALSLITYFIFKHIASHWA